MSRDFLRAIPGDIGGFARQIPGRVENAAGLGVDLYSTLNALTGGDPTAPLRLRIAQAQALDDPAIRQQLQAGQSPFFSGLLGFPVHSQPVPGASTVYAPGQAPPPVLRPNLPPLSAARQQEIEAQGRAAELAQDPRSRLSLPYGGGTIASPALPPPSRFDLRPGETLETDPSTGAVFAVGGATPRYLYKREKPTEGAGVRARATAEAQADASAQSLGFKDRNDPGYRAALRGALGLPAVEAPPPRALPAPRAVAPPAAPGTARVPPDDVPVGTLAPRPEGNIGYPSPAFLPGGQTAPPPAPTPPVSQQAAPLPAGTRATLSGGKLSITRTGPPVPGKAVPAIESRQLSLLASASQAARQALALLQAGPQHPLTVGGFPVGTPSTFAGPASGRALGALATVSGQPLAQEEAQLGALIAHATAGITALTGLRFTEQQLRLFDPLMPKLTQPTEVLAVHLSRLARFYDSLAAQQEALANLSDAQRQAATLALFQTTIAGLDEPKGMGGPVVRDLR